MNRAFGSPEMVRIVSSHSECANRALKLRTKAPKVSIVSSHSECANRALKVANQSAEGAHHISLGQSPRTRSNRKRNKG